MKLPRLGRIGEGTLWSLLGLVLPLGAALVSIPVLVRHLGTERFGVLTLCWAMAGYFNLFDMGLGRALVLRISRLEGEGRGDAVPGSFWTGTIALLAIGAVLGLLAAAGSAPIATHLLKVPAALERETVLSLAITGATIPFALAFGGPGNYLVAAHRQRELNLLRIPTGILSHLGAAGLAVLGCDLVDLALLGLGLRVATLAASWLVVHRVRPMRLVFSRPELAALLGMGSWMMVTNLLAPLATQLDRFLVGRFVGLSAVAHYSTSMDLALKAWMVLASIAPVLLPVLGELAVRDPLEARRVYNKALTATLCAAIPALAAMQLLGRDFLAVWINPGFAAAAWPLLAVLCSGVLSSLVGNLEFNLVQAFEGPRRTALAHAVLVPAHVGLIFALAPRYGAMGVVAAYLVRQVAETGAFLWMSSRHGMAGSDTRRILALALVLHALPLLGFLAGNVLARGAFVAVATAACAFWWTKARAVQNPIR